MLRWLLILAMAVLPWHGWAGASPAAAPAAGHHASAAVAVAGGEGHHGQDGADCAGHAGAASDHHAAAAADDGCPGCSGCAMGHSCSPVALPAIAAVAEPDPAPPQRHATSATPFASAERDPGLKPPIS